MAIIALVGNKGGAGKTTLAVNIASVLGRGANTALFDADPQGSSLQWRAIAEDANALPVFDASGGACGRRCPDAMDNSSTSSSIVRLSVDAVQTLQALRLSESRSYPCSLRPWICGPRCTSITPSSRPDRSTPVLQDAFLVVNQLEPWTRLSRLVRLGVAELGLPAAGTGHPATRHLPCQHARGQERAADGSRRQGCRGRTQATDQRGDLAMTSSDKTGEKLVQSIRKTKTTGSASRSKTSAAAAAPTTAPAKKTAPARRTQDGEKDGRGRGGPLSDRQAGVA